MTRTNSVNYTSPTFPYGTAVNDPFLRIDVQNLAVAVETHNHDQLAGKGLPVAGVLNLVYEQTLTSTGQFALATGWPAIGTGRRLEIELYGALGVTSGFKHATLQLGDATSLKVANYRTTTLSMIDTTGNASTLTGTRGYLGTFLNGNQGSGVDLSNGISALYCQIMDAGGGLTLKHWNAQGSFDYGGVGPIGQSFGNGSIACGPITRLQVGEDAGVGFVAGSRLRVFVR